MLRGLSARVSILRHHARDTVGFEAGYPDLLREFRSVRINYIARVIEFEK
jgi:hypothetical protein